MAVCRFCGQEFGSRQGVRAHLKACAAYLGRFMRQPRSPEGADPVPSSTAFGVLTEAPEANFDPVTKMRQQVAAEKLRLTLREIHQAHGELDEREEARQKASSKQQALEAQASAAAERQREAVRTRAAIEAAARYKADESKERRKAARRQAIQDAKRQAVDEWWGKFRLSSELRAQILQGIEAALAPLSVDELPPAELTQIAEGVRDRLYNQAMAAQNALALRVQQKQALQQYGLEYARSELRDVEGLDWSERWRIESVVQDELKGLTGDESRLEVSSWIDEILECEGLQYDDRDNAA